MMMMMFGLSVPLSNNEFLVEWILLIDILAKGRNFPKCSTFDYSKYKRQEKIIFKPVSYTRSFI